MGLLVKIFNEASDTEFKLAQDLVAIAIADGEISEAEKQIISSICQSEGITDEMAKDSILGSGDESIINSEMPASRRDRADYLTKLIRVMCVDGESSQMEIYLLEIIASKMGINHMELVSLLLMTASRRNFPGDIGSRALSSFLKNAIDPKARTMRETHDNLRKLFDLMAENVPQRQNAYEDRDAFIHAMDTATDLLLTNTLLAREFRSMGVDFEALLREERELAISRWTRK
jgi:uncharacterized tellurite resistance protein B-like protein